MARLTKEIRRNIIELCLGETFQERKLHLKGREKELGRRVRSHILGSHEKAFDAMPKELHDNENAVYFTMGGQTMTLSLGEIMPVGANMRYHGTRAKLDPKSSIGKMVHIFFADRAQMDKEKYTLEIKLCALLESFTTDAKLLEAWPDGKKYVEAALPATCASLPAVLPSEINEMMTKAKAA